MIVEAESMLGDTLVLLPQVIVEFQAHGVETGSCIANIHPVVPCGHHVTFHPNPERLMLPKK